jgi:phosphoribosylaminoimidazole-succinocarboxamide synthase
MATTTAALLKRVRERLKLLHRGKVRDTFAIPGHPDLLLQVASDRISIFDFVLPAEVCGKGKILAAMTVYWLTGILKNICPNHLVAYGAGIDTYLPVELCALPELESRALVVRKLRMLPVECIVRGFLTGSGWQSYQRTGMVCGHVLPRDLHDGSRLRVPLFTPTTKSHEGHDEDLDVNKVDDQFGASLGALSGVIYEVAAQHAERQGIIIADTKFEFGVGQILADEVLTPDGSRFWLVPDWQEAKKLRRSPQGYDKQYAREWGKTVQTPFAGKDGSPLSLNALDPRNAGHRSFVAEITVPEEVLQRTSMLYLDIFTRLTGSPLLAFQRKTMGM